jgi:hypothetical protein
MKFVKRGAWVFCLALVFAAALFFSWPIIADLVEDKALSLGVDPDDPQLLVTAEYMTVDELLDPRVIALAKRHNIWVAPCIRANGLNAELDRLYRGYKKAGVRIVFWPLLPREHCLYLNKQYTEEYMDHLDRIYAWADKYGHQIEALIVDIEPPNCQSGTDLGPDEQAAGVGGIMDVVKQMDRKEFKKSIPKFEAVLKKLHEHNTVAISTAMDYAAIDLQTGRPVFQDLSGGPSLIVNWDYVSFMNFGSQNTAFLKDLWNSWTVKDTRYLSYIMCKVIAKKWGNRAAISLGQTIPGEGHGAVWEDPAELGKDAAVCKHAGVIHFGIYDFQGIVQADDPDAWLNAVKNAQPKKPESLYGELERTF